MCRAEAIELSKETHVRDAVLVTPGGSPVQATEGAGPQGRVRTARSAPPLERRGPGALARGECDTGEMGGLVSPTVGHGLSCGPRGADGAGGGVVAVDGRAERGAADAAGSR